MGEPGLSVALCTYQGERFLAEQLASVATQTRLPDELVVGDDGSTDGTAAILRRFAERAPFPVRVLAGDPHHRLGTAANFGRTLATCRGDHVALADQDDHWEPSKLWRLADALAAAPDAALAFSDARLIDETGSPAGPSLWRSIGFDRREQRRLVTDPVAVLLRHPVVTGCTVLVRAALLRHALPFPEPLAMVHDQWLSLCAAAVGPLAAVPEPLVAYRLHDAQQVGITARPRVRPGSGSLLGPAHLRSIAVREPARFAERDRALEALADRFLQLDGRVDGDEPSVRARTVARAVATLDAYREHLAARDTLPPGRAARLRPVLQGLRSGAYRRFSAGVASALVDLVSPPRATG